MGQAEQFREIRSVRPVRRAFGVGRPDFGPASLGLLGLGTALDVLSAGEPGACACLAFWAIVLGVATGVWCCVFALLDWVIFARLGEAGVYGIGGFVRALVVGLFGLAATLRVAAPAHVANAPAIALEVAGAALMAVMPWIGRELAASVAERS
jgi:hypothetical protein